MPIQKRPESDRIREAVLTILRREVFIDYGVGGVGGLEEATQAITEFILEEYTDGPGVTEEEEVIPDEDAGESSGSARDRFDAQLARIREARGIPRGPTF